MKKIFLVLVLVSVAFGLKAQKTLSQLQTEAATIRDEHTPGANTATRVGGTFLDYANSFVPIIDYAVATTTSSNVYVASVNPVVVQYVHGQFFRIEFQSANTGSSTLNINGLGSVLVTVDGSTALSGGEIKAGQQFGVYYNGTAFQLNGGGGGGVTSFNSRTGAISPQLGDYSFSLISGTAQASQGGTGINTSSSTGLPQVNTGTWIVTIGSALQQIRTNSGGTNIEWFTPTVDPTTTVGDIIQRDVSGLSRLASVATGNVLLSGGFGALNSWGKIDLVAHVNSTRLSFANQQQLAGLSVVGVTGNATADQAAITAASDGQVLRRSGTTLSFGAVLLSSANAVSGALPVANGGTGLTYSGESVVSKTTTYSIATTDYTVQATSGTFTVTLPTAVGVLGKIYVIKNTGTGVITVATTSSQNIDASTTYSLSAQYKYVVVQSDNANWMIIGNN